MKQLNQKQKIFAEEYLVDFNATQAAIRAGYSEKTAYSIGWENLRKPEVKSYIQKEMEERVLSAGETKKLLSDIARSSLNDYFKIKRVPHRPMVERKLKEIRKDMKDRWLFEEEFISRCGLPEEELVGLRRANASLDLQILRLDMEIKRNPKGTKIVEGPEEWTEVVEIDLVKLAKDKEFGRVKSFAEGANGPKVELHDAGAALVNIGKVHGIFEKDNEQLKNHAQVVIFEIPDNGRNK